MAWYPLEKDEHLAFPAELREAVLKKRKGSRSKHKNYDNDEYVWAVYWSEMIGYGADRKIFPCLAQRWKFQLRTNWDIEINGPHESFIDDFDKVFKYWKSIEEFLSSFGLKYDKSRPSQYS